MDARRKGKKTGSCCYEEREAVFQQWNRFSIWIVVSLLTRKKNLALLLLLVYNDFLGKKKALKYLKRKGRFHFELQ